MIVTGVIAEYNPFHNGHSYQLTEARRRTGADYIVVVMNGDFMQRGLPAMWNKYVRSAAAVSCGADLVLELPVLYGTGSAEYFALGGVRLLDELQAVSYLSFGCETERTELLSALADLLLEEPPVYREALNQALSRGLSFPKARAAGIAAAVGSLRGEGHTDASRFAPLIETEPDELERILSEPNAILALEYLKALRREDSRMRPVPCLRAGCGYHAPALTGGLSSASAIRAEYAAQGCTPKLMQAVPEAAAAVLADDYLRRSPMDMDAFYPYLQYLLWNPPRPLTDYLDVTEDLANRIRAVYRPEYTFRQFTDALIHKQYTYTRIYRCLLHILLDIRTDDCRRQLDSGSLHYARILAFRKDASPLIRHLRRTSRIPIFHRPTDGRRILQAAGDLTGLALLEQDLAAARLYEQAVAVRYSVPALNDYTHGITIAE